MHICCGMGHSELVDFLLRELVDDAASFQFCGSNVKWPACLRLPLAIHREPPDPPMYAIAFNQANIFNTFLGQMKHESSSFRPSTIRPIPTHHNSNAPSKYSIVINDFYLIEMLNMCVAFGAFEFAQRVIKRFQSAIPTSLRRREYLFNSFDFRCYSIMHGAQMFALLERFLNILDMDANLSMLISSFHGQPISFCPTAFGQSLC